jgi:molybdopterin-guanine dinucleotide biosynthesis protein A
VLSSGCDLPDLPEGLIRVLSPAPSIVKGQQLIGLWDAGLAAPLETYLNKTQDYAFMGWARHCKARVVEIGQDVSNINTRSDLDAFKRREDPQSWP